MREQKVKSIRMKRRLARTRNKIIGHSMRPRLSVFRSNSHMYAQIIDDAKGVTVLSVHEKELEGGQMKKIERAEKLGELLAQKAKDHKVEKVVFDKGSYRYHGRVQAFADGARKGGLQF